MNTTAKKTRAGGRAWQDLKITLTFTAAEWMALQRDYQNRKAFHAREGSGHPRAEEYTWNDYIDGIRVRLVGNARYAVQRAEAMREVTRARAAGFDIPDAVLRLV